MDDARTEDVVPMARRLESEDEMAFVRYAESKGCVALKLRIDGQNGFPDRTVLGPNGLVLFLEFKAQGGQLSHQQKNWVSRLRKLGFRAFPVWDLKQAKDYLRKELE